MIQCRDGLAGYDGLMEGTVALTYNGIYPIFPGPEKRVGHPGSSPGFQPMSAKTSVE